MALNYIVLGLIFGTGVFLVTIAALNPKFIQVDEKHKRRRLYSIVGLVFILLGLAAVFFTDFLEKPIEF